MLESALRFAVQTFSCLLFSTFLSYKEVRSPSHIPLALEPFATTPSCCAMSAFYHTDNKTNQCDLVPLCPLGALGHLWASSMC